MNLVLTMIQRFFSKQIGVNPDSLNSAVWTNALEERMQACALVDATLYLEKLLQNIEEQKLFREHLLIPETWFFRSEEAFRQLKQLIHHHWIHQRHQRNEPIRILCVPCSTGEEAYSIAMTFLESGVPGAWFTIDAVDISEVSLEKARAGVYTSHAFRSKEFFECCDNYSTLENGQHHILPIVRQQVHFEWGNVIDHDFLRDHAPYDIIFCRNLFIYLSAEALQRVRLNFERLLKKDGLLFVSPVELPHVLDWDCHLPAEVINERV